MEFSANTPIYIQIMDDFKSKIISGHLIPNEKIPSVRDLAISYGVNPNTVQRALSELERSGLVRSERTIGRFISDDSSLINQFKNEILCKKIDTLLLEMKNMGYTKEEMMDILVKKIQDAN